MNFQEKVQSMTAKEIILAMVDSLTPPPVIKINMRSFGETKVIDKGYKLFGMSFFKKEICFGCAATNTICQISGKVFTPSNIKDLKLRSKFINVDTNFLCSFEAAINRLRSGDILEYNIYAQRGNFAQIINVIEYLPRLGNNYTPDELDIYRKLAQAQ